MALLLFKITPQLLQPIDRSELFYLFLTGKQAAVPKGLCLAGQKVGAADFCRAACAGFSGAVAFRESPGWKRPSRGLSPGVWQNWF